MTGRSVTLTLALAVAVGGPRVPEASTLSVPRVEDGPCAVSVSAGERVECKWLVVRENRDLPNGGTIRLPIVIFKSVNGSAKADPVLFIEGGPGHSTVAQIRSMRGSPILNDRDFIAFEQRGTQYAQPERSMPFWTTAPWT
jgi:hypothetical protein